MRRGGNEERGAGRAKEEEGRKGMEMGCLRRRGKERKGKDGRGGGG